MKFAGYDNLVIEGRADRPVYLAIADDRIEIRDECGTIDTLPGDATGWRGSLAGFAETVLPACQLAVELAIEAEDYFLYGIRDSRGLARALSGDYDGAIEDFQFFIDDPASDSYMRGQRSEWIEWLEQGFFTLDDALREELRHQ
mgnify:CR=1 FL=1